MTKSNVLTFIKSNFINIFLSLVVLVIGGYYYYISSKPPKENFVEKAEKQTSINTPGKELSKTIKVDIDGAVVKPGVYEFNENARITDAIQAAGGYHKDADLLFVAQNINKAQSITDGFKVFIPFKGQQVSSTGSIAPTKTLGKININSATKEELDVLPKIGSVTAQKIIDHRPYKSINDLISKKVVPQSTFNEIKGQITV